MRIRKIVGVSLLILLALQVGVWSASITAPKPQYSIANTEADHGIKLLQSGEYAAAKAEFIKAITIDKYNARAMIGLGYCYGNSGDWEIARSQMEDAVMHNPHDAFALKNYLNICSYLRQLDKGVALVKSFFNTTDKSAAKPCFQVAKFLVEIDYWPAQWFARKANSLDPKACPSSEVYPKALDIKLAINAAPKTAQQQPAQKVAQPSTPATAGQQQPGAPENPPYGAANYDPAARFGNTNMYPNIAAPTDAPYNGYIQPNSGYAGGVGFIPPNGVLSIQGSNSQGTAPYGMPYGMSLTSPNPMPYGIPYGNNSLFPSFGGNRIIGNSPYVNAQPYVNYSGGTSMYFAPIDGDQSK